MNPQRPMRSPAQHSPRQIRALWAVTTRAGVAARDELGAALDHGAGNTGPKALLDAADGSSAHERHRYKGQWV